jgi:type I restriction enzyme, S subunit
VKHKPVIKFADETLTRAVPADWGCAPVGDVLHSVQYGLNVPNTADGLTPIVGMKDIVDGCVRQDALAMTTVGTDQLDSHGLGIGDILLNRTNSFDLVGKAGLVQSQGTAVFASYLVRLIADQRRILPEFLNAWLNSPPAQVQLKRLATKAVGQANINPTQFKKRCFVPLPPPAEQRIIVDILKTWDRAILRTSNLIEQKRARLTAMSNDLLLGRGRGWNALSIAAIARHISEANGTSNGSPVLSCTKNDGLVESAEYFDRQVFSRNLSTYKVARRGDFVYATNHIEEGSIGRQAHFETALVSPMYTVFRITRDDVDGQFLYAVLKTESYRRLFAANTNASVDRRGGLRWPDFAKLPIALPSFDEQIEIRKVLESAGKEIETLRRFLGQVNRQRTALAKELLTGRTRISGAGMLPVVECAAQ